MKNIIKSFIFFFLFLNPDVGKTQSCKNNVVDKHNNKILYNKLKDFLMSHPTVGSQDSLGNFIPYTKEEMERQYSNVLISSSILKTDSIICDKNQIGIYSFGFASINDRRWLYLQYQNKIQFIDIDSESFDINKCAKKILSFLKKYDNKFSKEEKSMMLKKTFTIIYDNRYAIYSW